MLTCEHSKTKLNKVKQQDMDNGTVQQPVLFSPVCTKERFSELTGLEVGVIQGQINNGHLPTVKIGRYRLINLVVLARECIEEGFDR